MPPTTYSASAISFFVECYHTCISISKHSRSKGCISASCHKITHCFGFFLYFLLQCQEVRFLLELKSVTVFSRWWLSLFGTIVWLASDRLWHIMHWHWSWHSVFLLFLIATHQFFATHLYTPVSRDVPLIPSQHTSVSRWLRNLVLNLLREKCYWPYRFWFLTSIVIFVIIIIIPVIKWWNNYIFISLQVKLPKISSKQWDPYS